MLRQDIEKISDTICFRALSGCLQLFTFMKPIFLSLLSEIFSQSWALQSLAGSYALVPKVPGRKMMLTTFAS